MPDWTLITVEEFEANSNAILDRAEAGECFNVARNGVITMTVTPPTKAKKAAREQSGPIPSRP